MIAVPPSLTDDLERVASLLRNAASTLLRAPLSGPFATRADAGRALAKALEIAAGFSRNWGGIMPQLIDHGACLGSEASRFSSIVR